MAWTEEQVDRSIGRLLRTGVITAAIVVLVSAIWFHVDAGGRQPDYRTFHGEPQALRSPGAVLHGAIHGDYLEGARTDAQQAGNGAGAEHHGEPGFHPLHNIRL